MPMTGELFPCSVPLAEPCKDPVNRLPIYDEKHDNDGVKDNDDRRDGLSLSGKRSNKMRSKLTSFVIVNYSCIFSTC